MRFPTSKWSSKYMLSVLNCFPPSLPLAFSVVSMEVFAPHKMAEIRASTWQLGVPDPRIANVGQTVFKNIITRMGISLYIGSKNPNWVGEVELQELLLMKRRRGYFKCNYKVSRKVMPGMRAVDGYITNKYSSWSLIINILWLQPRSRSTKG